MRNGGLFKPARHKWIADIITYETPAKARKAARQLLSYIEKGRKGRLKIGPKRALTIARALQYAANRANATTKRKNLSQKERKELHEISLIYGRAAEKAWKIYSRKYRR